VGHRLVDHVVKDAIPHLIEVFQVGVFEHPLGELGHALALDVVGHFHVHHDPHGDEDVRGDLDRSGFDHDVSLLPEPPAPLGQVAPVG
jgi:hypothetical protein